MKALRSGRVPPSETLTPPSHKQKPPKVPKENVEPNTMSPESSLFRSPPITGKSPSMKIRSPLPPRPPPSSVPLKRKLSLETLPENGSSAPSRCDSGVQVMLRMRPLSKEEEDEGSQIAQKTSPYSISILDHTFTFDSVADASSTQQDIFQLVGVPLVENCLAGFNSSIFAYGQTGSGKTYTMWGLPSSLTTDGSLNRERGLTPRVFELLFSRIYEEQTKHADKQLIYQCHCSFLEIYNEQITDLLDPSQRNLQIREDIKTGVYVDCLTEEHVFQTKDVIQLLIKGLSNRRIGETSINAESSRSHCVFTCVVKCRSKSMSDGLSSLRTSRINLVDLAGSERQKATRAAGERLKEAGNINRSLSQLGNLINILAEVSQTGKPRHIPYRDSRLTFLLQESLGGNAKLAMICAISPSQRAKNETLSTLRFAHRAKAVKNKAVVNETMEDDVNVLREQIRRLKDELLRIKSNGTSTESNAGWNVQRSLNLLRLSLCRPRTLPVLDDDSDEEMEIVKDDVEITRTEPHLSSNLEESCANEEPDSMKEPMLSISETIEEHSAVIGSDHHPVGALASSMPSNSPSLSTSSLMSASRISISSHLKHGLGVMNVSFADNLNISNHDVHPSTTEHLAASIRHGLQIIDNRHRSSSVRSSSFRFSLKPANLRLLTSMDRVDIGAQTFPRGSNMMEDSSAFICSCCENKASPLEYDDGAERAEQLQIVPVDDCQSMNPVPKAVEKVLAGAIRREMALEDHCAKQAAEILHLNRLVQQYKHERQWLSIIEQTRTDKICRLEGLMDGVIPAEEFMEEEFLSLRNEHMMLKENFENHPEVLRLKIELKRVHDELDGYRNFFDMGERDVLLEEMQDLRSQLQYFIDYYSLPSTYNQTPLLADLISAPLTAEAVLEQERRCWAEKDSQWISLSEELRTELKSSRALADKWKIELESEKKCTEELKEALQTALEVHTRTLEQYADLEERHMALLGRHRKMREGVTDIKNAAARAGVKGAEYKFMESLAAQIEALRAEREKERRYWRDENKGLQTQLRDTAEAVEAAGELLVRLKEAEEAVATTQQQVLAAEQRSEKAYEEIADLKKNHEREIATLNQLLVESRSLKERPFDEDSSTETGFYSWFYNYDRCNV